MRKINYSVHRISEKPGHKNFKVSTYGLFSYRGNSFLGASLDGI